MNIVKELEELQKESKIYIYGSFVSGILKQSYGSSYTPPECVELWFHTHKSVNSLKRVKINDIYFKIVNNDNKPVDEVYINTSGHIINPLKQG